MPSHATPLSDDDKNNAHGYKVPKTAHEVRLFIGSNFQVFKHAKPNAAPDIHDLYSLTILDLLQAFSDWEQGVRTNANKNLIDILNEAMKHGESGNLSE